MSARITDKSLFSMVQGRQSESDDVVTPWRAQSAVPAGCDHEKLPLTPPGPVGHRGRLASGRKVIFPQLAPGFEVEGAEISVHRSAHEHEVARGGDRTPHV